MIKSILNLFIISWLCIVLVSCATVRDSNLVRVSYKAADALLDGVKDIPVLQPRTHGIYTKQPILITSFVNIDNLKESSTFGRVMGEQIGSRIAQEGYKVIEMKMRTGNVFVQEKTGELLLSRELRDISYQHNAYAVVVGTYGISKESVYITAKLIRAKDSVILSSFDYRVAAGPDTKQMLQKIR